MAQDTLTQARENYADAQEAIREQNVRFKEDLRFSNPAMPEQWDDWAKMARRGRPMLTLDRSNQYIAQIVNEGRQNKPSIRVMPSDSKGDVDVALKLNGLIKHIEYTSRAGIAYDTALELAARVGLGWISIRPQIIHPDTNEQELLICREHDSMALCLDPNSVEPDGMDAMFGFKESVLTDKAFERTFPKAKKAAWDSEGWFSQDGIRIAEYYKIVEEKQNRLAIVGPDGGRMTLSEDEYWQMAGKLGYKPRVDEQFIAKQRTVKWCKLSGAEVLEETTFPGEYVPLIPVLGYELWVEGRRYLCGMVRRMMDGQRLHNYEASAQTEAMMAQPKAPFIMPARAMEGHEEEWQALNSGNPAALTYEDIDQQGPINAPVRLAPPAFPLSFSNGFTRGSLEMEASVGMNRSSLGQQSNAVSGRAKIADKQEGDTANFHYLDNRNRGIEHLGRIILRAIPAIYDTRRIAKILGDDDKPDQVEIDPEMEQAVKKQGRKVISINPNVGRYDVRVKVGPSFTSQREEASERLTQLAQGNPALGAALAPLIITMHDIPEAEKISKVAIALLPPNVQEVYAEEEQDDIPPAVKAQMAQQADQIQKMASAMDQAHNVIKDLQDQVNEKSTIAQDQVKIAMSEIKAAKAGLDLEAEQINSAKAELDAKSQLFAKDVRIAQLELQFEKLDNEVACAQKVQDAQAKPAETPEPAEPKETGMTEAVLARAQAMMIAAVKENTQTVAKLQSLTVDAMGDMADAIAAPREIQIQRGKDGKAAGAKSIAVMPKGE
jgi:hypothetical protein